MQGFPNVVYVRQDGDGKSKKSPITVAKFSSELMKTGKRIKAGVYRLTNVIDVAGKPEPTRSDTVRSIKKKKAKVK